LVIEQVSQNAPHFTVFLMVVVQKLQFLNNSNIIHLISARQASLKEKENYRENIRQIFGA
jgi:uncharacterized DUF497 family protein